MPMRNNALTDYTLHSADDQCAVEYSDSSYRIYTVSGKKETKMFSVISPTTVSYTHLTLPTIYSV